MAKTTTPVVAAGTLHRIAPPEADPPLALRSFSPEDAPFVIEAFGDPGIRRWHRRMMDTVADALAWIEDITARQRDDASINRVVLDGGRPVGRVGLTRLDLAEGFGELSYWVLPTDRGRGIATRATLAVVGWALGPLGLHRINLHHSTQNPASCAVARATGFAVEGTARSMLRHEDGWHDMHLHARIAGDA
ncbi:MAG: GNAT family N-acetyltransferase [Aquihabitans sp.]